MAFAHSEILAHISPERIPSTVDFPIGTILKYYPDHWGENMAGQWMHHGRGWIWDMGFGLGKKTKQLDHFGFTVSGYEINQRAVESLRRQGDYFGKPGDVCRFGFGEEALWDTVTWLEGVDALLYQAVFPSLLGDSWKDALDAADMMLKPGKYIFVADFLAADCIYPELFSRRNLLGERTWKESAQKWEARYAVNQVAFTDLGLPPRTFAVGAPGPRKFDYDWSGDPTLLRALYDIRHALPEGFERFASHLDGAQFEQYLVGELGYTLVEKQLVPRASRATTPQRRWTVAPGVTWVFQKQPTYKYHPWKYGLRADDPKLYDKSQRRKGSPYRAASYFRAYYGYLLGRVRPSQRPIFEAMARGLGVPV